MTKLKFDLEELDNPICPIVAQENSAAIFTIIFVLIL